MGTPVNLLLCSQKCQGIPFSQKPASPTTPVSHRGDAAAPLQAAPPDRGRGRRRVREEHGERGARGARRAVRAPLLRRGMPGSQKFTLHEQSKTRGKHCEISRFHLCIECGSKQWPNSLQKGASSDTLQDLTAAWCTQSGLPDRVLGKETPYQTLASKTIVLIHRFGIFG